ncbi:hypothetical protein PSYAC_24503 [Pseudomonas syringae pv. actinidiae str. M302091]|nr:hypothetical protein PSYAC_24503 [Pseudomonas syringae pv. actinidiae str. M302091]
MLLWTIVPSWYEIEQRIVRGMGQQVGSHFRTHRNEPVPSISLTIRRFTCVRVAFIRAEWEACRILTQRFSDLDISSIVKELIDAVSQMAMIIAGSALAGGLTGAGAGLLLGGVSAVPMGAMGAALGVQASMFILSMLGLKRVAESFEEGLPRILDYYQGGIKTAGEGPRGESGLNPFMGDDPLAQNSAVQSIAQGHVEVVILLLGAIAHYLTRGRGDARILAQDMQVSAKGARLGQWMLKHEDATRKDHPTCKDRNRVKGHLIHERLITLPLQHPRLYADHKPTLSNRRPYRPSWSALRTERVARTQQRASGSPYPASVSGQNAGLHKK